MRTVLIFAHECAPYHRPESTVGAQRPAQFAKYLPEFGWRAVVLCCDAGRRGTASRGDLSEIAESARWTLERADPNASVVIATPSLKWDGMTDRLWRVTNTKSQKQSGMRSVVRKTLTAAKFFTGDYSQNWQPVARRVVEAISGHVRIDACIGEHSPDAGIFLARWFAERYGVPWVADFRDPILQPLRPLARRLYRPVVRRLLRTASGTINVNQVWAELDRQMLNRRSWAIPNGFDPDEFPIYNGAPRNNRLTIAYTGNIISSQRMEIFLEGLSLFRQQVGEQRSTQVRFVYRGGASKSVGQLAAEAGVADMLDCSGHINRKDSLSIISRSDALLLLSIAEPAREDMYLRKGIYPAKAFEYFGACRPIICVPGDGGLLDDLIQETTTGVILRSPRDVADHLARTLRQWEQGRPVSYQPDERAVSRFTRRALTGQLADVLSTLIQLAERPPDEVV